MELSKKVKDFLKRHEGLVLHVYQDVAGLDTIGYGHLLTPEDKASKKFSAGITHEQADELFEEDLALAVKGVLKLVKVPLTDGQLGALVDFTFNLGSGALASSTLLKKLNAGDYTGASSEFLKWDKARDPVSKKLVSNKGLARRRQEEVNLWNEK